MIGSGVSPVVLPWLALLFPLPTPPGGQSSPNRSAGSSIARQVLGLDSRTNGGCLLGCIWGQRRNWGVLVVVFQSCSFFCDLPPSGFPLDFRAWHGPPVYSLGTIFAVS